MLNAYIDALIQMNYGASNVQYAESKYDWILGTHAILEYCLENANDKILIEECLD
jgi:hypothetical protein